MTNPPRYSPSEQRILNVLKDGMRHPRKEVYEALGDPMLELSAIHNHISRLRPKLRLKGQDIVCEYYQQGFYYRQVRLLVPEDRS